MLIRKNDLMALSFFKICITGLEGNLIMIFEAFEVSLIDFAQSPQTFFICELYRVGNLRFAERNSD